MKITDLARHMAPSLPHKVVGIRPGEKIHEVLITEDDARNAFELADRYVILPEFRERRRKAILTADAKPVPPGFRFASNSNNDWLDAERLQGMIAESEK
jgi:UDP-N-acetylglucosamine 4,6-dehydratase